MAFGWTKAGKLIKRIKALGIDDIGMVIDVVNQLGAIFDFFKTFAKHLKGGITSEEWRDIQKKGTPIALSLAKYLAEEQGDR